MYSGKLVKQISSRLLLSRTFNLHITKSLVCKILLLKIYNYVQKISEVKYNTYL